MENLDDSENNAKISDSAYSNSCSNSQSRRSHSSKSTRSGSNSSGSSGYGGKQSTSGNSNNLGEPKKDKEPKKKKLPTETTNPDVVMETEVRPEPTVTFEVSKEEIHDAGPSVSPTPTESEAGVDDMDIAMDDDVRDETGFSCVISMQDGVVMYTTMSITNTLGFPNEMWVGRSFIDFVHPKDRSTFADQMTKKLAGPKYINGMQQDIIKIKSSVQDVLEANSISTMACRIRRYRGLVTGFNVKEALVNFVPFLLNFYFKKIDHGENRFIYLIIQAKPIFSAFKTPYEKLVKATPFVMRHATDGKIEYVDPGIVTYTGYLPQDIVERNALLLYHPEDLDYIYQMYDIIMKMGCLKKSEPYRMVTQNGGYVKMETEWSMFINPWSSKLEFVTGKHNVIEGPGDPNIFNKPKSKTTPMFSEEEEKRAKILINNIISVLKEIPKKSTEILKEQIDKRQDLILFMEKLIKEQPRTDEEKHVADTNHFEQDTVLLGGISPHNDGSDRKSSTATPLSYNQLNYNETLHRYFERQDLLPYENYVPTNVSAVAENNSKTIPSHSLSTMAENSAKLSNTPSSCDFNSLAVFSNSPDALEEYQPIRLTESILSKHNSVKEKELLEVSRAVRSSSKGEREKATYETRKKKKEHLARCNARYQPTRASYSKKKQSHGVKRTLKHESQSTSNKHHCSGTRSSRRYIQRSQTPDSDMATPSYTRPTTNPWLSTSANNMNPFYMGVGIPQQVSMGPVPTMPGMIPMYYPPPAPTAGPSLQNRAQQPTTSNTPFHPTTPCIVYGQPLYGPAFMYPQMTPYPHQLPMMTRPPPYNTALNPLGLNIANFKQFQQPKSRSDDNTYREDFNRKESNTDMDKTDGESSYSSFYSSFFKTECSSTDDSDEIKKMNDIQNDSAMSYDNDSKYYKNKVTKHFTKKKMEPPWMKEVSVSSELVYKYQISSKKMEDVLNEDKLKMKRLKQPSAVNEQLGQLYLDLHLQGVTAKLTLEEGITSSSSSGEETCSNNSRVARKKAHYSKSVMIYEEDAPMPSPIPNDIEEKTKVEKDYNPKS